MPPVVRAFLALLALVAVPITASGQTVTLSASSGPGIVGLNWNDVAGAQTYRVYQSTSPSGPFSLVAERDRSRHVATNAAPGVTLYFRVTSVSGGTESGILATASAAANALSIHRPAAAGHYRIGSSFVTDDYRLQRFLQARSINVASYRRQIIGAGIEYIWNNTLATNPTEHEGYVAILWK